MPALPVAQRPSRDVLWSLADAAEAWGVSRYAAWRYVTAGLVPAQRLGPAWYVPAGTPRPYVRRGPKPRSNETLLHSNET